VYEKLNSDVKEIAMTLSSMKMEFGPKARIVSKETKYTKWDTKETSESLNEELRNVKLKVRSLNQFQEIQVGVEKIHVMVIQLQTSVLIVNAGARPKDETLFHARKSKNVAAKAFRNYQWGKLEYFAIDCGAKMAENGRSRDKKEKENLKRFGCNRKERFVEDCFSKVESKKLLDAKRDKQVYKRKRTFVAGSSESSTSESGSEEEEAKPKPSKKTEGKGGKDF
jgi:hypothetical protein